MRKIVASIMDPIVEQSNIDRKLFRIIDNQQKKLMKQVSDLEDILYERDDLETM
jgi:hypothetical protein